MITISESEQASNVAFFDECVRVGSRVPGPYIMAADLVKDLSLVVVVFSDSRVVAMPTTNFAATNVAPEFDKMSVIDHGLTLKLGEYEAGADSIYVQNDVEF